MKSRSLYFLKVILVFVLVLNILGDGVVAILTMHHQANGQACFDVSTSADGGNACVDYHLGIMHELSQAVFWNLFVVLFVVLLAVFCRFAFGIGQVAANDLSYFRSRLKLSVQESLLRFYKQLGNWLAMFERKDVAGTSFLVQVCFGMP